MTLHRRVATATAVVIALTTLAACGGSNAAGSTSGGLANLKIALIDGNISGATLRLAEKQGLFKKHGLKVTLSTAQPAALVPAVVGGSVDVAVLNAPATLAARSNGVPIVAVSGIAQSPDNPAEGPIGIVTAAGSGITTAKDLEGKTIAVDSLFQLPHLASLNALRSEGVDVKKVKFIEVAPPQMMDALKKGQADAATMVEPFRTIALGAGFHQVLSASEGEEGWPFTVLISSEKYANANAKALDKLRDVVAEASKYANDHPDEVRALLPTFTKMPKELSSEINLYTWTSEYSDEGWQGWASLLKSSGVVHGEIDVDSAHN